MNFATVVLPTYNSFQDKHGSLRITINSILRQKNFQGEIIVVDNGSTDNTWGYLNGLKDRKIDIKLAKCDEVGNRSMARNIGVKNAKHDWIIFLEDDLILGSNDLLANLSAVQDKNTLACGIKRRWVYRVWDEKDVLEYAKSSKFDKLHEISILPKGINRNNGMRDLQEFSFIGHCGCISKELFNRVSGFDSENFDGWGREDVDLMLRALVSGASFNLLWDVGCVYHLTHPLKDHEYLERKKHNDYYFKREKELGVIFKVNHLFNVYENDGSEILIWESQDLAC